MLELVFLLHKGHQTVSSWHVSLFYDAFSKILTIAWQMTPEMGACRKIKVTYHLKLYQKKDYKLIIKWGSGGCVSTSQMACIFAPAVNHYFVSSRLYMTRQSSP